jgi:hypothetical protein
MVSATVFFVVLLLLIAWLWSEFGNRRGLRIALGLASIMSAMSIAYVLAELSRLNYNAWYGSATKSLIDTTIAEIEDGHVDRVMKVLRRLNLDYFPTYQNRAHYDQLVNATVAEMKGTHDLSNTRWDNSAFDRATWVGHWENDTGYWIVIQDGVSDLEVVRSGDRSSKMRNMKLSANCGTFTYDEDDLWRHEITLANKYEAKHVWRHAKTGNIWQSETLHKLIRASPEQRRFTQQTTDE